tara:strand:+ start:6146 stop:6946 length:801 start_codon:yes stop_codon:yes gene_type:complete
VKEKFEHKKSLGQHFLNSDYVPKKMCDAAEVAAGDLVVEIGPGTGVLTREILQRGAKVIAIEADERAISALQENFAPEIDRDQLTIFHDDARTLDLNKYGLKTGQYKVVANIPYYISGLLFRSFLDTPIHPNTLVFLVQKELAERIARDPKESLLSLSVKVFGDPKYIGTIKRGHFTPPPQVDSAIVAVNNINFKGQSKIEAKDFFKIIKLAFAQKRKQLAGNLAAEFERSEIEAALSDLNLPLTIRGEDVSLADWIALTEKLCSN